MAKINPEDVARAKQTLLFFSENIDRFAEKVVDYASVAADFLESLAEEADKVLAEFDNAGGTEQDPQSEREHKVRYIRDTLTKTLGYAGVWGEDKFVQGKSDDEIDYHYRMVKQTLGDVNKR